MKDAYHEADTLQDMYVIEYLSFSSIFFIKWTSIERAPRISG